MLLCTNYQLERGNFREMSTIYVYFINEHISLSTSIYDLVLTYVCHFHHHLETFLSNHGLSRYTCLHLGSLHPRIFLNYKCHFGKIKHFRSRHQCKSSWTLWKQCSNCNRNHNKIFPATSQITTVDNFGH